MIKCPPQLWRWDGSSWSVTGVGQVSESYGGELTLVYDANRNMLCLFSMVPNDLYVHELAGSAWTDPDVTSKPAERDSAGYGYDVQGRRIFVAGGNQMGVVARNDTWAWDGFSWSRLTSSIGDTTSLSDSMAYDSSAHRLVLVREGGEIFFWTGTDWRPGEPNEQAPVGGHIVYDQANHDLVLLARPLDRGMDATGSRTWLFANGEWRQVA